MSSFRAPAAAAVAALVLSGLLASSPASGLGPEAPRPGWSASHRDACPRTPKKADELLRGCSALEIVGSPDLFYAPALSSLDEVGAMLEPHADLGQTLALLREGSDVLTQAARRLGAGKPCPSGKIAGEALIRLGAAEMSLRSVIEARVGAMIAGRGDASGEDVEQAELEIAELRLLEALLEGAVGEARGSAEASEAVCDALAKKWKGTGIVKKTRDADGWLLLKGKGKWIVGLAGKRYPKRVGQGVEVRARGVRLEDGTILARTVKERAEKDAKSGKSKNACMRLRIAPVQPMPPYHAVAATHHPTMGYLVDGLLQLEKPMRLAARQVFAHNCPTGQGFNQPIRYAMRIDVEQGVWQETIALDLRDGEPPVGLPWWLDPAEPFTITATTYRLECASLGGGLELCAEPKKQATEVHDAIARRYGSYVSAVYASTAFSVTDNGVPGDFEAGKVTGLQLQSPIFTGTAFHPTEPFRAEGYRIVNGQSSKPQVQTVLMQQPFAVYEDDFYDPQILYLHQQVLATGQAHPAGIRWARIQGTRGNAPFWYATALPSIVRDRVHECDESGGFTLAVGDPRPPGDPGIATYGPTYPPMAPYVVPAVKDTFYKLPFQQDHQPGTGLMNIDDAQDPARHPEWQAYAFDLGAAEGTPMLATRGGRVLLLQESDPWNWNDPDMPDDWPGIGNYMWVLHEDETVGVYFHMQQHSLVPHVGDHVSRGQLIGKIGNTGNSTGPHVHFEVGGFDDVANDKIRIRFEVEAQAPTGGGWTLDTCYIPRKGGSFRSTNG